MALSKEAVSLGRAELFRLLRYGESEQPPLIVQPEIETAKSLDFIPDLPPIDTGGPYAVFEIKDKTKALPEVKTTPQAPLEVELPIAEAPKTITLFTVNFEAGSDPLEIARKVDRGMQRTKQYERMLQQIADWETKLQDGKSPVLPFGKAAVTPDVVQRWKQTAASMFEHELSDEPLTAELAKEVKKKQTLHEEAVVEAVEAILFPPEEKVDDKVEVTSEQITETKAVSKQASPQQHKENTEQPTEVVQTENQDGTQAVDLFVHDEFEDEPTIEANIFFEKLLYHIPATERERQVDIILADNPSEDAKTKYIPIKTFLVDRNF